jgi:threonine aldolase
LNATPRAITKDLGVDMLSFGGTKNGLMGGEAICFFNPELSRAAAPYARKQAMQLASKMRYVSAQFEALLAEDRWLMYASHANAMAQRLLAGISNIPSVEITRPVRANAIFAKMDRASIERAQAKFFFYVFDPAVPEVRWMTHWGTSETDIDAFVAALREATL